MADPLSITASIIAVIGAAEGVTKTLAKIRNIRNAPQELLSLINEVSDLRIIFGDVQKYLQNAQRSQSMPRRSTHQEELHHMSILINRAKDKLLELDKLIQYRLTKPESIADHVKVSRREWARAKSTIEGFRQSLRDIRLNVIAQMVIINSSHQSRIGLTIDDIHVISDQIQSNQSQAESRTSQQLNEHSRLLTNILSSQSSIHSLLSTTTQPRAWSQRAMMCANEQSAGCVVQIQASHYQRSPCAVHCKCVCHMIKTVRSPALLKQLIGTLFIGYSGCPIRIGTSRGCTEASCLSRMTFQACVFYLFPSWFVAKSLIMGLTVQSLSEVNVSLKVLRIVPLGSEIFRLTSLNDVDGLKSLLSRGLASPLDVDSKNLTAIWYALQYRSLQAIKFLLEAGADPQLRTSELQVSPFTYAWNIILEASEDRATLEILRGLFPDNGHHLEERHFSQLHKIILGIHSHDLEQHLAICENEVNAVDSEGATALMWAARRGDSMAIKLLLKANADPNIKNRRDATALSFATGSSYLPCVRLLLTAGADSAQCNTSNENLLHQAAFSEATDNSRELVHVLVVAGVDVNGQDNWGSSPLSFTALNDNDTAAAALLDYGADIDSLDQDGDSSLYQAIYSKSHRVMQLLLLHGASYTSLGSMGGILHYIASFGDLKTVDIMLTAGLVGINPDAIDHNGKTALQVAQERDGDSNEFVEKFQDLLADIRARNISLDEQVHSGEGPSEEFTWLCPQTWTRSLAKSLIHGCILAISNDIRALLEDRSWPSSIWTYWILGLLVASIAFILARFEMSWLKSTFTFMWDMIDPSDMEYI